MAAEAADRCPPRAEEAIAIVAERGKAKLRLDKLEGLMLQVRSMISLSSGRYLVVPDVHQNLPWLQAVLDRELGSVDGVVFLGDYFDAKIRQPPSVAETARFLASLEQRSGKLLVFLVGNHDLPYLYDVQSGPFQRGPSSLNPYSCSGYNPSHSRSIAAHWPESFRKQLKPLALVNGRLLSHAGLHQDFLPDASEQALDSLEAELRASLLDLPSHRHPALAAVSPVRGGSDPQGGVTWQDWHHEFEDALPWPQIVGHTALDAPQQKGRSWNLDTRGHHYALLDGEGIEIRCIETL